MAVSDPHQVAAMLVGEMHPDDAHGEGDAGADEGEEAAADEVMQAFQAGDTHALASSLRSFIEICMSRGKY